MLFPGMMILMMVCGASRRDIGGTVYNKERDIRIHLTPVLRARSLAFGGSTRDIFLCPVTHHAPGVITACGRSER